ncbi:MAG: glycosyltransferase family 39 protein [Gemmataceae bacterium]
MSRSVRVGLGALVLTAAALFFLNLEGRDLWSSHEARAAMDAQSLLEPGSQGLPRLHDGRIDLQKPPLFYWVVAGLARLRGGDVDELAVRLPAALSAVGVLLVVILGVGIGLKRPLAGLLAGLILATGIHFPWLAHIGRIDMPLTLAVTAATMGNLLALHGDRRWLLASAAACALAVLLKGPIGLALVSASFAAMLVARNEWPACWELRAWWRLALEWRLLPGLGVLLALVLPVYLCVEYLSGGQFSHEFLWLHNVTRGLGGSRLRSHPVWLYLPYLGLYLLPWSLLFFPALLWRPRGDRLAWDALAWMVGVVVLLSAARFKRADYLLPAYPGAAIFLACWLETRLVASWPRLALGGVVGVAVAMILGWAIHLGWMLPANEPFRDYRQFGQLVRDHAGGQPVVFFRAEAHALAFRVGRPVAQVVEWSGLVQQLEPTGTHWVVLTPALLAEARQRLPADALEEVARNVDYSGGRHERPLVLCRVRVRGPHANLAEASADRRSAD